MQHEELAGELGAAHVQTRAAEGGAHADQERGPEFRAVEALPGEEIEEGQPEMQVAERIERLADEVPVNEGLLYAVLCREDNIPEGAPVDVLEAEDDHLDREGAHTAGVHG